MRRGDLQYTSVKVGADEIAAIVARHLRPGELLYIATDEKARAAGERDARAAISCTPVPFSPPLLLP